MVGCDKEIFILRINYEEGSLNIVRSEPRRYRVHDIVARKTDDGRTLIAVCDELDGIEIVEYDRSLATLIKHLRGDSFSRKASKLCWINDQFLLATDKRGLISVVDIDSPNSNWLETVFDFALHDIPYGCCANPYKENSILVGSMLGAIYVVSLTKGATTQSDGL